MYCGYSLEASQWGSSNEYHNMFLWRNKKNMSTFGLKKSTLTRANSNRHWSGYSQIKAMHSSRIEGYTCESFPYLSNKTFVVDTYMKFIGWGTSNEYSQPVFFCLDKMLSLSFDWNKSYIIAVRSSQVFAVAYFLKLLHIAESLYQTVNIF